MHEIFRMFFRQVYNLFPIRCTAGQEIGDHMCPSIFEGRKKNHHYLIFSHKFWIITHLVNKFKLQIAQCFDHSKQRVISRICPLCNDQQCTMKLQKPAYLIKTSNFEAARKCRAAESAFFYLKLVFWTFSYFKPRSFKKNS